MTLLNRLWSFLTAFGPAPAGNGAATESGPKSLEASDRGMFDADEDDADERDERDEPQDGGKGGRERSDAGGERDERDEPDERDEDREGEEDADDEQDGARSERTEEDEDDDADRADESDEDDDGEEDDTALSLRESWEARLEADARANPEAPPRLASQNWGLREAARKRFAELRDKEGGEDGKFDAEAMFEVALDAALQVVGSYHDGVAAPAGDRTEKSLRNVQVGRALTAFRKTMGERLTEGVEQKMATLYGEFAQKFGWRRADKVPLKTLFRMAGGSLKGKAAAAGKKPSGKGADEGEDTANRQKRAALGAAGGPRALGRTTPEGGGSRRKEDRALRDFHEDVRARSPFFTLGQ